MSKGFVRVNSEECKGCGLCVEACPQKVLSLSEKFNTHGYHPVRYAGDGCSGCGTCFYTCPEPGSLTVFRKWEEITEVRYCPVCNSDNKVFADEFQPDVLICTQCLKPV